MTNNQQKRIEQFRQIILKLHTDPEVAKKLKALKQKAKEWQDDPEFVWEGILRSASTLGGSKGYDGLILNYSNWHKVRWSTVQDIPFDTLKAHFQCVLGDAGVNMRWCDKPSHLAENRNKIKRDYGNAKACSDYARELQGYGAKYQFITQFMGIRIKYGRNFWMDLCDPDFDNCIGIDSRVEKISKALGFSPEDISNYDSLEKKYLGIAGELNINGWRLDRLMYNYHERILGYLAANRR